LSSFVEEKDRKIIPRWRTFSQTITRGELDPLNTSPSVIIPDENFQRKVRDWEQNPTLPFASEVVAGAIVLGKESDAVKAADFIVSLGDNVPVAVRKVAIQIVNPANRDAETNEEDAQARGLRERLYEDPRSSVAWVDLALHYARLGALRRAQRAMDTAVELAPNNRFILRSAARFFVHVNDPERAEYVLLRSRATPNDPWLVASEIAVQSILGRASDLIKGGRRMLEAGAYGPLHLSELASAIGTLEMEAQGGREARRLFKKALVQPTENSVAQARWAFQKMGTAELAPSYLVEKRSFEAQAWASFHGAEWDVALSASRRWLDDQPFSSRPAVLGSYVAGVWAQDLDESVRLARAGLRANRGDPFLANNLAFALASLGKLDEAAKTLQQMKGASEIEVMRLSTTGMIEYRRGRISAGRALYLQAIEKAAVAGFERIRARASVFMALEERRANTPESRKARELAERLSRNVHDPDLQLLVRRLR
jgi:tetratricopeptide (TPR) repeat protein